jgi:phage terminase large subunit-like protein
MGQQSWIRHLTVALPSFSTLVGATTGDLDETALDGLCGVNSRTRAFV